MAALTEEQSLLKDQASAWVREQSPVVKFREMRDSGVEQAFAPTIWPTMVEMGWTGILVPEQYGGSDLGYLTFGIVLEELGRQLVASPLFASALVGASGLLLGGSDAQKKQYLPAIVDGTEIVTLAVDEGPRHAPARTALQAKKTAGGYALDRYQGVRAGRYGGDHVRRRRAHARCSGRHGGHHAVPRPGERKRSFAATPQHVRQPRLREPRTRERRSRSRSAALGARRQRLRSCSTAFSIARVPVSVRRCSAPLHRRST